MLELPGTDSRMSEYSEYLSEYSEYLSEYLSEYSEYLSEYTQRGVLNSLNTNPLPLALGLGWAGQPRLSALIHH